MLTVDTNTMAFSAKAQQLSWRPWANLLFSVLREMKQRQEYAMFVDGVKEMTAVLKVSRLLSYLCLFNLKIAEQLRTFTVTTFPLEDS